MICSRLTSKFDLSKQVPLSRSFHPIIGDPSRIPNGQLMIAKIYKVTVTSNEYSSVLSTWAQIFFRENNVLYSPHSFGLDLKKLGNFYEGDEKLYEEKIYFNKQSWFSSECSNVEIKFEGEITVCSEDYKKVLDLGEKIEILKSGEAAKELNAVIKRIYDKSVLRNVE